MRNMPDTATRREPSLEFPSPGAERGYLGAGYDFIRESVEAGEYASTSEVNRDAMQLWQRQREHAERIK
jgi:hypothetical protein